MTKQQFQAATAIAYQQYTELATILGGETIESIKSITDPQKKSRAISLILSLNRYLDQMEKEFHRSNLEDIPVMEIGSTHAHFLTKVLIPNAGKIQKALGSFYTTLLGFEGETNRGNEAETSGRYRNAFNSLLDFWLGTLSEYEEEEHSEFIETCNNLRKIVNESWFDPDKWEERKEMLRPVLMPSGKTNRLRDHIRIRLNEIYRTYIFGQYMSCVALSRTLVEFMMYQNASKLGVSLETSGKWEKTLSQIIDEVKERKPEIAQYAETVREHGNRVIHPKKRSVVAIPRVIRSEALSCIENTVALMELLYGGEG